MKRLSQFVFGAVLLACAGNSFAWWGNGWNWNPWPVWTPMYWMEEVGDSWDNDGPWDYGPYGGYPYGGYPYGGYYGSPYGGYYGSPYGGYGAPWYGGGYPYNGGWW